MNRFNNLKGLQQHHITLDHFKSCQKLLELSDKCNHSCYKVEVELVIRESYRARDNLIILSSNLLMCNCSTKAGVESL